jgi:hypothetical protein
MHRWVLDAQGEIVKHLAALPQYYYINGQRIVAHTPAEYMVLPDYGFYAITLMRKFFRTCENCVTSDTAPAVIGIWDIAALPGFATPVPIPLRQALNWGLRAVDRALTATASIGHLRVEVLEEFDETFDELFEGVAAAVLCVPEKNAVVLRWRYGPDSPYLR